MQTKNTIKKLYDKSLWKLLVFIVLIVTTNIKIKCIQLMFDWIENDFYQGKMNL